jgi:putative membrane protein
MRDRIGWLAVALVIAGGTGCGGGADAVEENTMPGAAAVEASSAVPARTLTDAEIAAVVVAANSIDVSYGEIARERASDERVKQFAETMITDHTAVNESAVELVARLGVTPEENDVSRSLQASAEDTRAQLRSKTGKEFDIAYIRNEVEYHRAVLDALDSLLIPDATNAELRETLVSVRPAFLAHLRHAESLQQALEQ